MVPARPPGYTAAVADLPVYRVLPTASLTAGLNSTKERWVVWQFPETSSGCSCQTLRGARGVARRVQRIACRRLQRRNLRRDVMRVATVTDFGPTEYQGGPPNRASGALHRLAGHLSEQPSTRRWPVRLPNGPAPMLLRRSARTAGLRPGTVPSPEGSRRRHWCRRPPSLAPDSNPPFHFTWLRSTRLASPRLLDFVEEGLPVTDVLFEDGPHFLLHRAAVSAGQGFERLDDFGRNVSNSEGCHMHLLLA